jgi:hypothetical protein
MPYQAMFGRNPMMSRYMASVAISANAVTNSELVKEDLLNGAD